MRSLEAKSKVMWTNDEGNKIPGQGISFAND